MIFQTATFSIKERLGWLRHGFQTSYQILNCGQTDQSHWHSTVQNFNPFVSCKHHVAFARAMFLYIVFYTVLLYSSLAVLNLYAQPESKEDMPPAVQLTNGVEAISTHTFDLDDVDQLALNLQARGNIELVSTDSNMIRVTFTKLYAPPQSADNFQLPADAVKNYLDNISLTETRQKGTLQLKVQFPNDALAPPQTTFFEPPPESVLPSREYPQIQSSIEKQVQLSCTIGTPPDISVKLETKDGDIRLQRLRGKMELVAHTGDVHLGETQGTYSIKVTKGDISGKILLTRGQNVINTQNGSIELEVLDAVAAPLDLTAHGGRLQLRLPENYPADVEVESQKQQVVVNLPVQIEDDSRMILNDGGPLLRLRAKNTISILPIGAESAPQPVPVETVQLVPQTVLTPVIDGNLFEKAWMVAARLQPFHNTDGTEAPENPTEVLLMWDAQNFYIGVKAYFPNIRIFRTSQTQQDSPIWEDEAVEILLDPDPQTEPYYHFIVNPIGALLDQKVKATGPPILRFAPADVQWETQNNAAQTFKADSKWNSDANVATRINATFWSLELAISRRRLEQQAKDTWYFNIHRKAQGQIANLEFLEFDTQREYSYWLPTYDVEHPWWPHWKEAMGALKLVTAQPQLAENFGTEEKLHVTTLEIEGNTRIPTEIVQNHILIKHGDVITNSQLSWLIAGLENHDWFQAARLETEAIAASSQLPTTKIEQHPLSEKIGSNQFASSDYALRIHVTEAPVRFARHIDIIGNRSFPVQFIKEWFDLVPGYLAIATVKLKQQLIANFYWNRGYELATVTYEFLNDVLQFSINEGSLDEIRFTGNNRISSTELVEALDLRTDDVYYQTLGQVKIRQMHERLSQNNERFKSIRDWRVQREAGKNIMIIDIEEQPIVKPGVFPILGFNRVHGLVLGASGGLLARLTDEELFFGSLGRGFSSRIWNYDIGIEKRFFNTIGSSYIGDIKLGAGYYKLTDVSYNNALLPTRANLSAAFYGFDFEDYYQRHGYQIWITHVFGTSAQLRFRFTQENHDNLSKSTDWSYFNRGLLKRGNPRIEPGQLRRLSLSYTFDTRDEKYSSQPFHNMGERISMPHERTRRGWRGHFAVEMAGERLGGAHAFNFYKFELSRYTPIFGPHHLNIRLAGDFSDTPLPRQLLLYLGGTATLRGYDFNTFAGDRRVLLNIEYRIIKETMIPTGSDTDVVLGWAFNSFFDAGQVWWFDEQPFSDFSIRERLKTAVGIGFSVFVDPLGDRTPRSLAVEIAVPLKDFPKLPSRLQDAQIIWRLERMF